MLFKNNGIKYGFCLYKDGPDPYEDGPDPYEDGPDPDENGHDSGGDDYDPKEIILIRRMD